MNPDEEIDPNDPYENVPPHLIQFLAGKRSMGRSMRRLDADIAEQRRLAQLPRVEGPVLEVVSEKLVRRLKVYLMEIQLPDAKDLQNAMMKWQLTNGVLGDDVRKDEPVEESQHTEANPYVPWRMANDVARGVSPPGQVTATPSAWRRPASGRLGRTPACNPGPSGQIDDEEMEVDKMEAQDSDGSASLPAKKTRQASRMEE